MQEQARAHGFNAQNDESNGALWLEVQPKCDGLVCAKAHRHVSVYISGLVVGVKKIRVKLMASLSPVRYVWVGAGSGFSLRQFKILWVLFLSTPTNLN